MPVTMRLLAIRVTTGVLPSIATSVANLTALNPKVVTAASVIMTTVATNAGRITAAASNVVTTVVVNAAVTIAASKAGRVVDKIPAANNVAAAVPVAIAVTGAVRLPVVAVVPPANNLRRYR